MSKVLLGGRLRRCGTGRLTQTEKGRYTTTAIDEKTKRTLMESSNQPQVIRSETQAAPSAQPEGKESNGRMGDLSSRAAEAVSWPSEQTEFVPVMRSLYKSTESQALPLYPAVVDVIIVVLFLVHVVAILSCSFINSAAPIGPISEEFLVSLRIPQLKAVYGWWVSEVNPLIAENPPWIKAIFVSALFLDFPFEIFVVWCFVRGYDFVRVPCLVWSSKGVTLGTLLYLESCFGEHASPRPVLLTVVYLFPLFQAVLLFLRMWSEKPFELYVVRTLQVGRRRIRRPSQTDSAGRTSDVHERKKDE